MVTKKQNVFNLLSDFKWHTTNEIVSVGSFGGLRRLQELTQAIRAKKYAGVKNVEKRRCESDSQQFEYRFVKNLSTKEKGKQERGLSNEEIREIRIVERKSAIFDIPDRSRLIPVRSLPSSRVTLD